MSWSVAARIFLFGASLYSAYELGQQMADRNYVKPKERPPIEQQVPARRPRKSREVAEEQERKVIIEHHHYYHHPMVERVPPPRPHHIYRVY